jgi:hypothetical protein
MAIDLEFEPVRGQGSVYADTIMYHTGDRRFAAAGAIENLALRHQLSVYKRTMMRPKLRTTDRLFWIGLARVWAGWSPS